MKNTTEVPNELLVEAHKEACLKWKRIIENLASELFKPKYKAGDWIIWVGNETFLYKLEKVDGDVGWSDNGKFRELSNHKYRLATRSETESHLIKEAEFRGFKHGATISFISARDGEKKIDTIASLNYDSENDCLDIGHNGYAIYSRGIWATIVEQPKVIELTLEDIAKMKGVDVSLIKIVK